MLNGISEDDKLLTRTDNTTDVLPEFVPLASKMDKEENINTSFEIILHSFN